MNAANSTQTSPCAQAGTSAASDVASKAPRAAAFHRIFEKVCEQLNFNERERAWFRQLLKEELNEG